MSESSASRSVTWPRNAAAVLAAILAASCVDDSVAPGPQTVPDARGPSVISFVEVSFEDVGTPNMSSSVLSAPSIAALEELRAERERLRESGEDVAFEPTIAGEGTIQFGERTDNGTTTHGGRWWGHGTFDIRNADAIGVPYPDERHNLTLQAISTPSNVNGTALRTLTVSGGDPADIALRVVPSGRVATVQGELVIVKPDVLQIVPEDYIEGVVPGVNVFPYGFVVRHGGDQTSRTLQADPAPQFHEGEVDIAFSAPLEDGQNIVSMSITFVALDYGPDDTFLTQSWEEQTAEGAAGASQRASSLNAVATTLLPTIGAWSADGPGLRTLCSVRTAGDVGSGTGFLVKIDWSFPPSASPPSGSTISTTQPIQLTFTTEQYGIRPENMVVQYPFDGFRKQFADTTFAGNGTNTITTPGGPYTPGEFIEVDLQGDCPSGFTAANYDIASAEQ